MVGFGKSSRGMNHGLLITGLVVGQGLTIFHQGLTEPSNITVPENAKKRWDEPTSFTVTFTKLNLKVLHDRLRGCQPDRL
jgi:hypothetical protein